MDQKAIRDTGRFIALIILFLTVVGVAYAVLVAVVPDATVQFVLLVIAGFVAYFLVGLVVSVVFIIGQVLMRGLDVPTSGEDRSMTIGAAVLTTFLGPVLGGGLAAAGFVPFGLGLTAGWIVMHVFLAVDWVSGRSGRGRSEALHR